MADELSHGLARFQVPQTESLVPGRTDGVISVQGEANVRNEVVVAGEGSAWLSHDALLGLREKVPGQ